MKNREAQALFQESKLLYRERRYDEALAILRQLDAQYPHTRNILYPIVKCYRRLGRFDEAAAVCDRLILEFEDERAKHVRANIQRALDRAGAKTIAVAGDMQYHLDDDLDAGFDDLNLGDLPPLDEEAPTVQLPGGYGATGTAASRMQQQGREIPWIPIGFGVIAIILLIGVFAALSGGGSDSGDSGVEVSVAETREDAASAPEAVDINRLNINIYVYWGFATIAIYCITLYITLMVSNKLPYSEFMDNALNVFGISLLCTVAGYLPCIGIIINIIVLRKQYEFEVINFIVLIGVSIIVSIPFAGLFFVLFWNSFAALAESGQVSAY